MPNLNFNDFVGDKEKNERNTAEFSDKNPLITAFLCLFLGFWGLHSFYVGRSNSGKFRLALGLLCVLLAIVRIKLGYLFVLLALLLSLMDFLKFWKFTYGFVQKYYFVRKCLAEVLGEDDFFTSNGFEFGS